MVMKNIIVFATSNVNKVREVKEMLVGMDVEILSLSDLGLSVTHEEDSSTFEGNAKIKAEDIAEKCSYPVLSDDSGLAIEALDGFPGVHSARFMEGHSYEEKNLAILDRMKDKENRKAAFYTAMAFIDKSRNIEKVFFGKNEGHITEEMDYHPISGFGYDPIFFSDDLNKTFGQATAEEKDSVSHRGRALMSFMEYYKNEYTK